MQFVSRAKNGLAVAVLLLTVSNIAAAQHYQQTNLVSDVPGLAALTDSHLVNAWGIVHTASSPWWVNSNGKGESLLYNGSGVPFPTPATRIIVTIPPVNDDEHSDPTGIVANTNTNAFLLSGPGTSARFIFCTEEGTIAAWAGGTTATIKIPNQGNAIYKGLAINAAQTRLYAANFLTGHVDVFESSFQPTSVSGGFSDPQLPAGYAPFNVQNVGGAIFVTFAKQGEFPDEVDGKGLGFVDKFDADGNLLMRFQHGPWLDAPWGVALAPSNFGEFSNRLLVGNFGSGQIVAYDATSGEFEGFLHGPKGRLVISGLWGIGFGAGNANSGPQNALFFAAGIDDEKHGLFGMLTAISDNDENEVEHKQNPH